MLVSPQVPDLTAQTADRQLWAVDLPSAGNDPGSPAPAAPAAPTPISKGHAYAGCYYSGSTTPTFSGTAASGEIVSLLIDGQVAGTALAVKGHYVIAPTEPLSAGSHTAAVTISDDGQTSDPSPTTDLTIDTASPRVHLIDLKHSVFTFHFTQAVIHAATHTAVKLILMEGNKHKTISALVSLSYDPTDFVAKLVLPSGKDALPPGDYHIKFSRQLLTSLAGNALAGKVIFNFVVTAPKNGKK